MLQVYAYMRNFVVWTITYAYSANIWRAIVYVDTYNRPVAQDNVSVR